MVSRQDGSLSAGTGRTNQKARTRDALLKAAATLAREGREPSMSEAAELALVSVATAYRYFSSAAELWWEASSIDDDIRRISANSSEVVASSGSDPQARLEALIRSLGFAMLEDQVPYRRVAKGALDQWFRQHADPQAEDVPVRQGRRNEQIRQALTPLEGRLPPESFARLAHALGLVVGTESMISLIDAVGLDVPGAKTAMLDAARWMLAGALAELDGHPGPTEV